MQFQGRQLMASQIPASGKPALLLLDALEGHHPIMWPPTDVVHQSLDVASPVPNPCPHVDEHLLRCPAGCGLGAVCCLPQLPKRCRTLFEGLAGFDDGLKVVMLPLTDMAGAKADLQAAPRCPGLQVQATCRP